MTPVALVTTEVALPFHVGALAWDPAGRWLVAGASHEQSDVSRAGGVASVDAVSGRIRWQVEDEWRVIRFAVRPDGRTVAVAARKPPEFVFASGEIRILDTRTGDRVSARPGRGDVQYSPDGALLVHRADSTFDTTFRVLLVDANTGQVLRDDLGPAGGTCAFSHDSALLAVASGERVVVWDVRTGTQVATVPTTHTNLAFTPGGERLLCTGGKRLTVLDLRTGTAGPEVLLDLPQSPFDSLRPRLFSPDRQVLVVALLRGVAACGTDGRRLFHLPLPPAFSLKDALATTSNGRYVAANPVLTEGAGRGVLVLDGRTGAVVWQDDRDEVRALAYSPSGAHLAVAGRGPAGGFVRIHDTRRLALPPRRCRGRVFRVAVSGSARRVAAADTGTAATVFDADTGGMLMERSHSGVLSTMALGRDGECLATGGTNALVHLFAAADGLPLWVARHAGRVNAVTISTGGTWLATASADRTARRYPRAVAEDAAEHRFDWENRHPGPVTGVAVSADDRWVATTCTDHVTRILDAATGTEHRRFTHPNGQATAIGFGGALLAVGVTDGTAATLDPVSGTLRRFNHPSDVVAAAISADGARLATAGAEFTVRVWDLTAATENPLHTTTFDAPVTALAFHPADRTLAVATEAGRVTVLDSGLDAGTELYRIPHPAAVRHLAYSADGAILATACDDEIARAYTTVPL